MPPRMCKPLQFVDVGRLNKDFEKVISRRKLIEQEKGGLDFEK